MSTNEAMITTADGIAYRLVRELEDLIELAGNAMRQANVEAKRGKSDGREENCYATWHGDMYDQP